MALRTFNVSNSGDLLPLVVARRPWKSGVNEAECRNGVQIASIKEREPRHRAPELGCSCGFYAYGAPEHVEYIQSDYVLAVVACSGRIRAGTKGIRSEKARLIALWAARDIPDDLLERIRTKYPDVRIYRDRGAMLAEFPTTVLDTYDRPRPVPRRGWQLALPRTKRSWIIPVIFGVFFGLALWPIHGAAYSLVAGFVAGLWALTRIRCRTWRAQLIANAVNGLTFGEALFAYMIFTHFFGTSLNGYFIGLALWSCVSAIAMTVFRLGRMRFRAVPTPREFAGFEVQGRAS